MIRLFNAFQLVCLFAAGPFGIDYLYHGPFAYAMVAFWVALVAYLVLFGVVTTAMYDFCRE